MALPHRHERVPGRAATQHAARAGDVHSNADLPWLQPYPDRLLDEMAPSDEEPDAVAVARETIELAFLAALQVLPPRQRAALVLRDVLGWPADETASLLETSVAAANSAVQRARATMQAHLPSHRLDWTAGEPRPVERELLERFIDAHERCDAEAAVAIAAKDLRVTMPPYPWLYDGLDMVAPLMERAFGEEREGDWRLVPTHGEPDAGGRELPAEDRRHGVPRVQGRRAAGRGRRDRGDHDLRAEPACRLRLPVTLGA